MTYRELFLLIYQSDIPEETKQYLYNVTATEKLSFGACFRKELEKILQQGKDFSLKNANPDSKFQTLNDIYIAIQNENSEAAQQLNKSYAGVRLHIGIEPFLRHAQRRQTVLERAKQLLSDVDAINDAIDANESLSLTPSPQTLREVIAGEAEYKHSERDDLYQPDQLLDFLYSDELSPHKHLFKNHGRILGYLKQSFSQDEFTSCGFTDEMFSGEKSSEHLRMGIALQAVLAALIENAYITEDQTFFKDDIARITEEKEKVDAIKALTLQGDLSKALVAMDTPISGAYQFLKGHLNELLETLSQTLAPYRKRLLGENLPEGVNPILDKIYKRLGDIYLAGECVSKTEAVVSDKLSFPIQYLVSKPELFDADIHAQDNVVQLDDAFCQSYNRGILHFAGFESDMQHFYNAKLPEAVRLYVSAVIEQSLSEFGQELYSALGKASDEALINKVDEIFKSVSQTVLRALNPIDVERAIAKVKDGDLNLQIIENITAIEQSLAMLDKADTGDVERITKENATGYRLLIHNLKLALAEFNGYGNNNEVLREILKLSQQAIEDDIHGTLEKLANFLFEYGLDVDRDFVSAKIVAEEVLPLNLPEVNEKVEEVSEDSVGVDRQPLDPSVVDSNKLQEENTATREVLEDRKQVMQRELDVAVEILQALNQPSEMDEGSADVLEDGVGDETQVLDPRAQEDVSVEALSYDDCKDMLEGQIALLRDNNPGNVFAQRAEIVLNEVERLHQHNHNHIPEADLKNVLFDTASLLKNPTPDAAQNYKRQGEQLQKRSKAKILGGAMLALAGVVVLGLSVAACVFTFGAAAPLSILGFTLGASTLGAGLSVAGAVVGAGAVVSGVGLFASGCKRKPLRRAMDEFATEADQQAQRIEIR